MTTWRSVLLSAPADVGDALALGVELRRRESAEVAHWGPRRVRAATVDDLADDRAELTLGVRPLSRRGGSGGWVRGDVSWDLLRRGGGGFRADQRAWFVELYGIAHDVRLLAGLRDDSDWVTLDSVTSPLLWPHLRAAAAVDVPVVAAVRRQHVAIAGSAEVAVRMASAADGSLRVGVQVDLDGRRIDARNVRAIGTSGVYAVEADATLIRLTLSEAPLRDGVAGVLAARSGLVVPSADVRDFAAQALPRLRRHATIETDPGVVLPRIDPTVLVVGVDFGLGDPGAGGAVEYRLEWLRHGIRRAPWRDVEQGDAEERDLRGAVAGAWAHAPDVAFAEASVLDGVDAAEFVARVLPALEALEGVRVEIRGQRREFRELRGDPRITIRTVETDDPDWFDLGIIVEIDGRRIPFAPLFAALALRRTKMLLADGSFFSLAHPALERLRDLLDDAAEIGEWEAGPRIARYHVPLWEDFEDLADNAEPAVAWRAAARALRDGGVPEPVAVPRGVNAELRPYQRAGLDRLALWRRHGLGGILADDMGLGKTLQVLALLAHARDEGEKRPFLVVAPTSVMSTWRDEAERFTPGLRVHLHDRTVGAGGAQPAEVSADVVVTSYGLLRHDENAFVAVPWAIVVLDEAQFVKNPATRQHRAVAGLRAGMVLAVTGTPLENSLTELWAILSLTCPGLFPSARRFREEYVKPIERGKVSENAEGAPARQARLERLRSRLRPFVLRRTKESVAPELPPRQEQEVRVELSPAHRAVYETVLQRERQKVLGLLADLDRHRFIVFRSLTLLRMLALAPELVDAGAPGIRSTKLEVLREQLRELAAEGHRALVFSQFTSYLELVRADLLAHGIDVEYLDGSTRRRQEVIHRFRTGSAAVFLISLKAGGFGLTLTEADYVFLLDPSWNPAAEAQAVDRTHRIGQTRPVNVYRLIAAGTIEEKVVALQQRKARLYQAVLGNDDALAQSLTAEDVRTLLAD